MNERIADVPTQHAIDRMDDDTIQSLIDVLNECMFHANVTLAERRHGLRKRLE